MNNAWCGEVEMAVERSDLGRQRVIGKTPQHHQAAREPNAPQIPESPHDRSQPSESGHTINGVQYY